LGKAKCQLRQALKDPSKLPDNELPFRCAMGDLPEDQDEHADQWVRAHDSGA